LSLLNLQNKVLAPKHKKIEGLLCFLKLFLIFQIQCLEIEIIFFFQKKFKNENDFFQNVKYQNWVYYKF